MNDEIKELMTNIIYNEDVNGFICTDERYKEIKNYITNLQQKVEQYENPDDLTLFYMWLDEKAKDKMKKLQQENEKSKERIDKAIEYIYDFSLADSIILKRSYKDLLKILKGDNND